MQSRSEPYLYVVVLSAIALVASYCGEAHAAQVDIRYYNPNSATMDSLEWEVDGQRWVQMPSGCPGPGNPTTGPICIAGIQLGEGPHTVKARAWVGARGAWTKLSDAITVHGAPEPGLGAMVGLGAVWAGLLARRR